MHLFDKESGFYGSVPIVAGTVSLAVGAAMAAKMQESNDIGLAHGGDGAVKRSSMKLLIAKIQVLLCTCYENNLFSSPLHI